MSKRQEELLIALERRQGQAINSAKWESWKQWTLSHNDWPEFQKKIMHDWREGVLRAEQDLENFYAWLESAEGKAEQLSLKITLNKNRQDVQSQKQVLPLLALSFAVITVGWIFFQTLGVLGLIQCIGVLLALALGAVCIFIYKSLL